MNPILSGILHFFGVMTLLVLSTIAASMTWTIGNSIVFGVVVLCVALVFETGIISTRKK